MAWRGSHLLESCRAGNIPGKILSRKVTFMYRFVYNNWTGGTCPCSWPGHVPRIHAHVQEY